MDPFPLLLVAHVDCTVSLWDVRAKNERAFCFVEVNYSKRAAHCINTLKWEVDEQTLFVGDESGYVKAIVLEETIAALGVEPYGKAAVGDVHKSQKTLHRELKRENSVPSTPMIRNSLLVRNNHKKGAAFVKPVDLEGISDVPEDEDEEEKKLAKDTSGAALQRMRDTIKAKLMKGKPRKNITMLQNASKTYIADNKVLVIVI